MISYCKYKCLSHSQPPPILLSPCRRKDPDDPPDSCRVHGSLSLNKVAGNFHVTAGKSLPLMRGHAHLAAMMGERDYNFREDRQSICTLGPLCTLKSVPSNERSRVAC